MTQVAPFTHHAALATCTTESSYHSLSTEFFPFLKCKVMQSVHKILKVRHSPMVATLMKTSVIPLSEISWSPASSRHQGTPIHAQYCEGVMNGHQSCEHGHCCLLSLNWCSNSPHWPGLILKHMKTWDRL